MVPRLKNLNGLRILERNPDILFSQKSRQTKPLQVPQQGPYGERGLFTGHTSFPSDGKGPPWREMPVSGDFLNIYSRVPSEGAPPEAPSMEPFKERFSIPRAPFILLSKFPVDEPSFRFPKWDPYGKIYPPPEPFIHILQGPQQGSLPSRFSSQRETLHLQSPFQPYLKVPCR